MELARTPRRPRTSRGFLAALPRVAPGHVLHLGIDENGLGPVLGPLVVAGVAFRASGPRPSSLGRLVGDSKALVSHGDVALGEAWARALLTAMGPAPRSPAEILSRLCLDDEATMRARCPSPGPDDEAAHHVAAMCFPLDLETFLAEDGLVGRCEAAMRRWATSADRGGRGVSVVGVRATVLCPSRYNAALASGRNKLVLDLHEMERVLLTLHQASGDCGSGPLAVDAVCGKVGGMDYYSGQFGPLSDRLCAIEAEGPMASSYRFPGLGRVTFLRDADAADPLVGLASLVGKYLRELTMGRVVRYLRAAAEAPATLPDASGYRDPATKRFIAETELVRKARKVPDACFLRNA